MNHRHASTGPSPQELLLSHLDFIRSRVEHLCRRYRARGDVADDVFGELKLKLLANDYEVLRRYRGDARFTTYLAVVIDRFFLDWIAKEWAPRRGEDRRADPAPAVVQDAVTLVVRDGFSLAEAARIALGRSPDGSRLDLEELESAVVAIGGGEGAPRSVALETAGDVPDETVPSPEQRLVAGAAREHVDSLVEHALAELAPQDRLLVRLRYANGMSVAGIARLLGLPQRELYRRTARSLKRLRKILEAAGQSWPDLREHLVACRGIEPGAATSSSPRDHEAHSGR